MGKPHIITGARTRRQGTPHIMAQLAIEPMAIVRLSAPSLHLRAILPRVIGLSTTSRVTNRTVTTTVRHKLAKGNHKDVAPTLALRNTPKDAPMTTAITVRNRIGNHPMAMVITVRNRIGNHPMAMAITVRNRIGNHPMATAITDRNAIRSARATGASTKDQLMTIRRRENRTHVS
jgi:hypothetical protein